MATTAKTRRRARERRQTSLAIVVLVLVLSVSIASWAVFFKAWKPNTLAQAPRFALLSSTGRTIALDDFLGKQEVVLIFYMGAG